MAIRTLNVKASMIELAIPSFVLAPSKKKEKPIHPKKVIAKQTM
jgi:hypothetical protein